MLRQSMREIAREGRGIVVLIRDAKDATLSGLVHRQQDKDAHENAMLKEYGVGAQILTDLGVHDMVLLSRSAPQKIVGLEGYGLDVVGRRDIPLEEQS
jgi:3,4-dihydroxy 2-butanone 4-phosphate synthase/GTP cyclohydrolase II